MDVSLQRFEDKNWRSEQDIVADEEPLQITIDGHPIAVVMRTPGDDEDLVKGFLKTEGILGNIEDISRVDLEQKKNHALVFLSDEAEIDYQSFQRNLYSASSCGICGKASIESICQRVEKFTDRLEISPRVILSAPDQLRAAQEAFQQTGGIHAAGLFVSSGELLTVREDVGRHNAVDKVVGWAWSEGLDMSDCFIQVSGRVSFEVMQKAMLAGVSTVSAISAPSSLAVDFANEAGMQLYGFVRKGRFNKYT